MIVEYILLASFLFLFIVMIGVISYDITAIKQQRLYHQDVHSKRFKYHPSVSIIIMASGNVDIINECINSIKKTTYRNYEVIVIPLAHHARIKKLLDDMTNVVTFKAKRGASKTVNAQSAYRQLGHNELVMVIDDTTTFAKDTLNKIAWHSNFNKASAMVLNEYGKSPTSLPGLFETYYSVANSFIRKAKTGLHINQHVRDTAIVYPKDLFLSHTLPYRSVYLSDTTVTRCSDCSYVSFFGRLFKHKGHMSNSFYQPGSIVLLTTILGWIIVLTMPVVVSYFGYVAIVLHQPVLLYLCVAGLGLYLVATIWWNDLLTTRQKLLYSLLSPAMYILFYLLSWVQIAMLFAIAVIPAHQDNIRRV